MMSGGDVLHDVPLALGCLECPETIMVPFDALSHRDVLVQALDPNGWILSVAERKGLVGVFLALLCPSCAKEVYGPELVVHARKVMRSP